MPKIDKSKEKVAESTSTFCESKPNSPIVQTCVTFFTKMIYKIFPSLTKVKSKPNQTQYKPNSNPIPERPKMNLRNAIKKNYKDFVPMASKKQSQFKPKTNPISPNYNNFNFNDVNLHTNVRFFKIYTLLIKSLSKIAENSEIMAFFDLKRLENHEKAVKNQSGKEVKNVLEPI